MLVGREREQLRLAQVLAAARLGQSGVLVLRGEAGIGKTALLDDTASHAGDMSVARISGTEAESTLGFSGLHQLLQPALHLLDDIPTPQSDALAVALTLRGGVPPERFAVGAATLSLLSRFAQESPLLAIIDDAHLLDPPSAETLLFVARRLVADPIALLIAIRPDEGSVFEDADIPTAELAGLDLPSATALIATSSSVPAPAHLTAKLHQETSGNPLALVELSRDIDRLDAAAPDLPLPVPQTVARAFGRRVNALPENARLPLLVAAIADGDMAVTAHAAAALNGDVDQLVAAETAGLLRLDGGRVVFRHPLVRSAVYVEADARTRRDVHRAVAAAFPPSMRDRRAWHLSEACLGPDEAVASELSDVADRAEARGAYGVAAAASVRSAELTADHATRGARLSAAAESAWLAGQAVRATELLTQAAELVTDGRALAEIEALRGNISLRAGSLRDAYMQLTVAAERSGDIDADMAVQLLSDAVTACFYLCDTASGTAAADRIELRLDACRTTTARTRGQMALGIARIVAGDDGVRWLREAVSTVASDPSVLDDPRRPDWSIIGSLFLRESAAGRDAIHRVVQKARTRTAIGALPNLLFHVARDDATTDRWQSALADYGESVALARETGQSTDLTTSLAGLAWLQARMGRNEECRTNAAEAMELASRHQIVLADIWAQFGLGELALVIGDTEEALQQFLRLESTLTDIGFRDVDVAPGPELTDIYLRLGRPSDADATAREYLARAEQKNQPWALARAHRAMALNSGDADERASHFAEALHLHELSPDKFEQARTWLSLGSSLRRDKKRTAARPHLRCALEEFERLGARPWADEAARELEATGERARRSGDEYSTRLTTQELRIAQMLAGGATTKEAAAALFLSPKTVEYHLRHVYQKLGIASRSELREVVGDDAEGQFP